MQKENVGARKMLARGARNTKTTRAPKTRAQTHARANQGKPRENARTHIHAREPRKSAQIKETHARANQGKPRAPKTHTRTHLFDQAFFGPECNISIRRGGIGGAWRAP